MFMRTLTPFYAKKRLTFWTSKTSIWPESPRGLWCRFGLHTSLIGQRMA